MHVRAQKRKSKLKKVFRREIALTQTVKWNLTIQKMFSRGFEAQERWLATNMGAHFFLSFFNKKTKN